MAGRAVSEEAGQELARQTRSGFGAKLALEGLQIQLKNGQASPAIISTVTIPVASASASGAMSNADKAKLDGIAVGADKTTVDTALSATSENPVQNKAVYSALSGKAASSHTHPAAQVTGLAASRALMSDGDGHPAASEVTSTELGYLDGVTSPLQPQINAKAALASPTFTGAPKAPTAAAGTSTTQLATTAFVTAAVSTALSSAMTYKGAAAKYSDITATSYKAGWCWIVSAAGTFAGQACEAGDMVVANKAKGTAAADADFDVIQSNIGYVTAEDVKTWFA